MISKEIKLTQLHPYLSKFDHSECNMVNASYKTFTTIILLLSALLCAYVLVTLIANNMNPDQTAPSLIRFHSVCFHDKSAMKSQFHLNICSRHNKQTAFSEQNYWQDKG